MKRNIYLVMLFLSLTGFSNKGTRSISGTVYDQDSNQSLPGVRVQVEGTNITARSDANGHYAIKLAEGKTTLVFSLIGYEQKSVKAGKSDTIAIRLTPSNQQMQEVAAVGYGARAASPSSNVMVRGMAKMAMEGRISGITRNEAARYPADADTYKGIVENSFNDPKKVPLSTFAVDVDAASYSNFRRFINNGTLPPKDAVRIEEMINYFHYDLAAPVNDDPVAIHTELSVAPWNAKHRLLRIGLKAKQIKAAQLPPSNLVFLLDVSGSMYGANRLPLVKAAMKLLVDQLRDKDHVAIVTYAGAAGLKLASTPGDQKMKIKDAIESLEAGGSTAGGAGIKLAYRIARENFIKAGNNRIVLATDGDFNIGMSSDQDMEQLIVNESQDGVSLSVLGFGMGNLKDSKMEVIADKGHGNYAYIDNISEAKKAIVTEFGSTLFTVAKDVKIQVEFNPGKVQAYRLLGYENRLMDKEDFNNDKKTGGDMGTGHTVTALYELIPAGIKDEYTNSVDPLKYQSQTKISVNSTSAELVTIKFRYKSPDANKSKMQQVSINDQPVDLAKTSNDFRFASAVAELGLILRNSEFKQQAGYDSLISRAKLAKGKDEEGYRSEFISLAENAKLLSKSNVITQGTK
jgi:Ca-activated chloride channel family protein